MINRMIACSNFDYNHFKTLETRHSPRERFAWKWHLTVSLYERGYKKQDVIHFFLFIDWIMNLPDELKHSFSHWKKKSIPSISRKH